MAATGERANGHGDQRSESRPMTPIRSDLGIEPNEPSCWQKLAERGYAR